MSYRYDGSVTDERMDIYLETLFPVMPDYMEELAEHAHEGHVPVMRRQTGELLRFFIELNKICSFKNDSVNTTSILEIGTAIGYSALYMAECSNTVTIDTIEKVPARIEEAKENIHKYDAADRITLLEGDAAEVLDRLVTEHRIYDIVFMDAAKAQYSVYMEKIYELTKKGAVVITDNVLQEGELLNSRYAVNRRDRTIHSRMREFLYDITHSDRWHTIVLPSGDGMAVSIRK